MREELSKLRGTKLSEDTVIELLRIRDELRDKFGDFPSYFPHGTIRFLKFSRPEERGNPLGGLLFSSSLNDSDRIEIIEYFGKNPDTIPWKSLGTRAQIISACKATGVEVPQAVLASGCGDSSCPHCGCT